MSQADMESVSRSIITSANHVEVALRSNLRKPRPSSETAHLALLTRAWTKSFACGFCMAHGQEGCHHAENNGFAPTRDGGHGT